MRIQSIVVAVLLCAPFVLHGQAIPEAREARVEKVPEHYQLYGGYSYQSNSFNGQPGHRQGLNGWEASLGFPYMWRKLRFKADVTQYRGTNYGAPQHAYSILAGFQYDKKLGRETLFGETLAGVMGINQNWGPQAHPGMTASFTTVAGGGLDTPISRKFAVRVSGGWVFENLALIQAVNFTQPYHAAGIPSFFGKVSAGMVWKF
jgi:hypothetical protein